MPCVWDDGLQDSPLPPHHTEGTLGSFYLPLAFLIQYFFSRRTIFAHGVNLVLLKNFLKSQGNVLPQRLLLE